MKIAVLLSSTLVLFSACQVTEPAPATSEPSPDYVEELERWHADREASLTSETGYLTIVGLHWLDEGEHTLGTASGNDLVLPDGAGRAWMGKLHVEEGRVSLQPDGLELLSDAQGGPTRLSMGSVTCWVIDRAGRLALRVRDTESELRSSYRGTERFPVDPAWRVEARFVAYPLPIDVEIPNVMGTSYRERSHGELFFETAEGAHRLQPTGRPADGMFVVFGDTTNGNESYGGGRFLNVPVPDEDGRVVLDFNKARNPPCAYNPNTTCPLPPPQNRLPVAVHAGERVYEKHEP